MAGIDGDVEKAFTNGDPEAVLDFLALRSRQLLRFGEREDEENGEGEDNSASATCSVPLFTSDTDMAAFVRDLTIDDAISLCFSDLPSGSDDTMITSLLMPPRPEKRLTHGTSAAAVTPAPSQKQPSATTASRRPAANKQQPSSSHSIGRDKPRGFLSSLLGRGHKGRRRRGGGKAAGGGSPRKPSSDHQRALSSEHLDRSVYDISFENDRKKHSAVTVFEATVHTRLGHDSPVHVSKLDVLHDDLTGFYPSQDIRTGKEWTACVTHDHQEVGHGIPGQMMYNTGAVAPNQNARTLCNAELQLESTVVQKSNINAMTRKSFQNGHVFIGHSHNSTIAGSNELMSSNRCTHKYDHHVYIQSHGHSGLTSPSQHTEKPGSDRHVTKEGRSADEIHIDKAGAIVSQRHQLTPQYQNTENSAEKLFTRRELKPSDKEEDQKTTSQKPWEGLCDGIDAFIDFERDPNLEMPLDSHLSAQFHHERGSSDACGQGDEEHYKVFAKKHQVAETSEKVPRLTLQAPEQELRSDENPVAETPCPATAPTTPIITTCCQPPSSVSTSTQTECPETERSDRSWNPTVGQCLRSAISKLSSLSECATCEDVISRTLADLRQALLEAEEVDPSSETNTPSPKSKGIASEPPTPPSHIQVFCGAEKQTVNILFDDGSVAEENLPGKASSTPSGSGATKTDTPGKNRRHDYRKANDQQGYRKAQMSHREAGSSVKTSQSQSNKKHPEQSTNRSRQSGGGNSKKNMTPSRASVDSDSGSTSTVTSEPITVLLCQRANHSLSESSKEVNQLSEKVVSRARPFAGMNRNGEKAAKSESPDSMPSSVLNPDLAPAVDLNIVKTESTVSVQSATIPVEPVSPLSRSSGKYPCSKVRYAGEADRDYESFMTSSWSEMTSVSSVCDVVTSADESSYYSGDDDDADNDDEEEEDDLAAGVRLGLLDEDRDDSELRQHRLQRHLAAVLRQTSIPTSTVETVVAATGERLNSQERHMNHINQGLFYPFTAPSHVPGNSLLTVPGHERDTHSISVPGSKGEGGVPGAAPSVVGRKVRSVRKLKKGGSAAPRLFSPDRQVSLLSARQMTSEEFREAYDRSTDITKVKRSQLDGDIPWDLIPCSDTDDDARGDKAWYNVTSEEESLARAYGSDTDSSTTVSDW